MDVYGLGYVAIETPDPKVWLRFGTEIVGLLVGDDWLAHEFCEGDIWGHQGLTAQAIRNLPIERESA